MAAGVAAVARFPGATVAAPVELEKSWKSIKHCRTTFQPVRVVILAIDSLLLEIHNENVKKSWSFMKLCAFVSNLFVMLVCAKIGTLNIE